MFASRVKAVFLQHRWSCFRSLLIGMTGAALWLMVASPTLAQTTVTFSSPGSYPWTVPNGVTSIHVDVRGAEGGATNDGAGGKGAKVVTMLSIPPGVTTLYVRVGGRGHNGTRGVPAGDSQGGFNGGGNGGIGIESAGGGGGASDIRTNDSDPSTRLVSAAGGGGAGTGGSLSGGGDGGDPNGYAALNTRDSIGGFGATQTSGGSGGQGADGATGLPHNGGGGGGGWFGGGGGGGGVTGDSGAGGGGGSSNSTGTGTTYTRAAQTGAGYVSITYTAIPSAKIEICHFPPGNRGNWQTITINDTALPAHQAHGDFVGSCLANCEKLCDDGNKCTVDVVPNNTECKCQAQPRPAVDCSDGLACTTDRCDPAQGCLYASVVCYAPDLCTASVCSEPGGTCEYTPVVCPTGQACNLGTGACESASTCPCDFSLSNLAAAGIDGSIVTRAFIALDGTRGAIYSGATYGGGCGIDEVCPDECSLGPGSNGAQANNEQCILYKNGNIVISLQALRSSDVIQACVHDLQTAATALGSHCN